MKSLQKLSFSKKWVMFFWLLTACSYSKIDSLEGEPSQSSQSVLSRALAPIVESKSNPDLFENWENISSVNLNGGGIIDVPWFDVLGNNMNIPDMFRFDVKKEDSWEILYHTLIDEKSYEPNYILFYNKKAGILKGFYYNLNNENNQNFYWVLEASEPSYSIPANTLVQNYQKNKFVTTTNVVVHQSVGEVGHLNSGWNAFSFELPYGYGENSNLKVSIYGYNEEKADIKLNGDFTGVVNIPQEAMDNGGILSSLSKFTKSISSVLSAYSSISGFIGNAAVSKILSSGANKASSASKFFQSSSSLFSKTKTVNLQGTINGTMELTGSSTITKSGLVKSINNVPLTKEEIGLWTMRKPTLYSLNYFILKFPRKSGLQSTVFHKLSCDSNDDSGFLTTRKNNLSLDSYIVINPSMKDVIESFRIVEASVFGLKDFFIPYVFKNDENKDNVLSTNYTYYPTKGVFFSNYLGRNIEAESNYLDEEKLYNYYRPNGSFLEFQVDLVNNVYRFSESSFMITRNNALIDTDMNAMINVVVEFTYKDGYSFISSRNYPVLIKRSNSFEVNTIEKELLDSGILLDPGKNMFNWPMPLSDFLIQ